MVLFRNLLALGLISTLLPREKRKKKRTRFGID